MSTTDTTTRSATRAMSEVARRWDRRLDTIKRLAEAAHAEAQRATPKRRP